jgi:uncharacterized membrane protein HdeD (DUF308 family)
MKIKLPLWLRIMYLISGTIILAFALVVFINMPIGFIDEVLLMGIALLIIGTTRILNGVFDQRQSKWIRLFNFVIGVLMFPIGVIATVSSLPAFDFFIVSVILSLAILLLGIIGIVKGFEDKKKVGVYRAGLIFYGFILIGLSFSAIILDSILTQQNILVLINTAILILGLRRLMEGILAHKVLKQPKSEN